MPPTSNEFTAGLAGKVQIAEGAGTAKVTSVQQHLGRRP